MIYPGTGVGSGFQLGTPSGPNDPNRKNLQKYLMNKLGAAPGTAGSYASISGQAPGTSVSGNPFLAMLAGRPGENFQSIGVDANAGANNLSDSGSLSNLVSGDTLPGHYNTGLQPATGRDGQTPGGAYSPGDAWLSAALSNQNALGGGNLQSNGGNVSSVDASGPSTASSPAPSNQSQQFISPGMKTGATGLAAQVTPNLGMNIAGLDPSIQAALMYHIGLYHGAGGGAQAS